MEGCLVTVYIFKQWRFKFCNAGEFNIRRKKKNGFLLHQQKDDMGLEDPYTPEQVAYENEYKTYLVVKIAYQRI